MANDTSSDPRRSGIYRLIRLVALADLALGVAVLLLGPDVLGTNAYRYVGLGLAIAGGGVFLFFTWLAGQAARR
jgi:hypothetical protein